MPFVRRQLHIGVLPSARQGLDGDPGSTSGFCHPPGRAQMEIQAPGFSLLEALPLWLL